MTYLDRLFLLPPPGDPVEDPFPGRGPLVSIRVEKVEGGLRQVFQDGLGRRPRRGQEVLNLKETIPFKPRTFIEVNFRLTSIVLYHLVGGSIDCGYTLLRFLLL